MTVSWYSRRDVQAVLLAVVVLLGFGIRIFDLTDPPLDFHPTRQLRSAILARSFYYQWNPAADPVLREKAVNMGNSLEVYEPPSSKDWLPVFISPPVRRSGGCHAS